MTVVGEMTSGMTAQVILLLISLTSIASPVIKKGDYTYVDSCPSRGTWREEDLGCRNKNPDTGYHCTETKLSDKIVYVDYCTKPIQIPGGQYPWSEKVDEDLELISKPCPPDRYSEWIDPVNSNTTSFFQCELRKEECNGEGQKVCTDGSTTEDRTCKCDYKNYYTLEYNNNQICCHNDAGASFCRCKQVQDSDCNHTTHELVENYVCKVKCKNGEIRKQEPPTYPCVSGSQTSHSPVKSDPQTTQANYVEGNEKKKHEWTTNKTLAIVLPIIAVLVLIALLLFVCREKIADCCYGGKKTHYGTVSYHAGSDSPSDQGQSSSVEGISSPQHGSDSTSDQGQNPSGQVTGQNEDSSRQRPNDSIADRAEERREINDPNPESHERETERDLLLHSRRSGENLERSEIEEVQVHGEAVAQEESARTEGGKRINPVEIGTFLSTELLHNDIEMKPCLRDMMYNSGYESPDVILNEAKLNNPNNIKEELYESVTLWIPKVKISSEKLADIVHKSLCKSGYVKSAESFKKQFAPFFPVR